MNVESSTTLLEDVILVHQALPEINLDEVSTQTTFLGKTLSAPLIIEAITGGHPETVKINATLAEVVEELKLGMGVGSQRAALENKDLEYTYSIVREKAPNAIIIANIGASQLVEGYGVKEVYKAIDMVKADAIAIHLNACQEAIQPEGNTRFKGVLNRIKEIIETVDKPVIVKEVGNGISRETAEKLVEVGVKYIDVAGLGGTNWVLVEKYRALNMGRRDLAEIAETFTHWGIPTAASIVEVRSVSKDITIIASGGIRTGLDIAKAIALGADIAGFALPALKWAIQGNLREKILKVIQELKMAMFLTASRNINELKRAKIVIKGVLREWLICRGININSYLSTGRARGFR
ncbi:MAG TPA: type 2 isopentenyl-diphosphate Delta-isomerase [Desulfurococcales archaeon]|nr:type 2 isopentenyl-diphosphate Delta-isomerase [Desulfurococcales archaeon]